VAIEETIIVGNYGEVSARLREWAYDLIASIPEEHIGSYPFTRLYHDCHLSSTIPLMWNPEQEIPGWVFQRYKVSLMEFLPDDSVAEREKRKRQDVHSTISNDPNPSQPWPIKNSGSKLTTGSESTRDGVCDMCDRGEPHLSDDCTANKNTEEFLRLARITTIKEDEVTSVVAATVKKKIVKKAPLPVNPHKVKAPKCAVHETEMEWNPVEQKFRCPETGCGQTKRPKRNGDDVSVIVGKGSVSLRFVATREGVTILLISDDNVALDITRYVTNPEHYVEMWKLVETANAAADKNEHGFADPDTQQFLFEGVKVGVLGVDDFLLHYEK
jgi:hypothetical protein